VNIAVPNVSSYIVQKLAASFIVNIAVPNVSSYIVQKLAAL
jgi:hypothetical protein